MTLAKAKVKYEVGLTREGLRTNWLLEECRNPSPLLFNKKGAVVWKYINKSLMKSKKIEYTFYEHKAKALACRGEC